MVVLMGFHFFLTFPSPVRGPPVWGGASLVIIFGDGELRLKTEGWKSGFSSFTNGLYQTSSEPVLCPG